MVFYVAKFDMTVAATYDESITMHETTKRDQQYSNNRRIRQDNQTRYVTVKVLSI